MRILTVIVVISAIELLERFFDLDHVATEKLARLIGLHFTFVATAVLLAWLDRLDRR